MMDDYKIRKGKPPIGGVYVAYVEDPISEFWCVEQIRTWHMGTGWQGNPPGTVYGWVGPLPAFKRGETKPTALPAPQVFDL